MNKFSLLLSLLALFLTSCTSVVSSTIVYAVAKRSEITEKTSKSYTATRRCVIRGEPSPYAIAETIVHGAAITHKYHNVLNNYEEAASDDPLPPHQVAYAFYTIAERMGDSRANKRMQWLAPYFTDSAPQTIEEQIDQRYLPSYLNKCFSVPVRYRQHPNFKPSVKQQNL